MTHCTGGKRHVGFPPWRCKRSGGQSHRLRGLVGVGVTVPSALRVAEGLGRLGLWEASWVGD